ncbi:lipoprotein NlpI [Aestuariibacter sp. AA17]|uniref:Lipoprotein NlpI n=1 Tax=Fluctibacter corallii TaxID=2984329 RepID=A0ABT3A5I0_9ALTE|nr:lipoprotein NlpI [Aestuariibacter sp. AA17]MCV2883898.1 lipoprotein NlpI [Aestuariibacter sp. AA17]
MLKSFFILWLVSFSLILSGCAGVPSSSARSQMGNLLLAEPLPASARSQMTIVRYNQILAQAPLQAQERAELLYQRGMLYDSVGLSGLAQYDYNQALKLKPDMAEAYNSIGIHFTQQQEFIQAYEAFDSSLEIDPEFEFAFLNRGIALYYGGRPELAVQDLGAFLERNENDPYRALWAFIAEYELSPEQATRHLREASTRLDPRNWATLLVELYLDDISESELLGALAIGVTNQRQLTDRLCEAYFYLGKYHAARGHRGRASNYFKLALSTNVYEYVEHRYARLELNMLREDVYKENQAQQ